MATVMYWYSKMPEKVGHDENVIAGLTKNVIAGLTKNVIAGLTGNLMSRL